MLYPGAQVTLCNQHRRDGHRRKVLVAVLYEEEPTHVLRLTDDEVDLSADFPYLVGLLLSRLENNK